MVLQPTVQETSQMPQQDSPREASAWRRLVWLSITLVTAVSAIGAVALHVMGMGAHRAYLSSWGIDSGLFTKSSDWLMYNGYYAFLVEMAGLLSLLTSANWVIAKWLLLL